MQITPTDQLLNYWGKKKTTFKQVIFPIYLGSTYLFQLIYKILIQLIICNFSKILCIAHKFLEPFFHLFISGKGEINLFITPDENYTYNKYNNYGILFDNE